MIRIATPDDAGAVHAIYAPIVRDTAISFEWDVPTVAEIGGRMKQVLAVRPWLVWDERGEILGYSYAAGFRERAAYRWGAEVTIYVREDARGRGLGPALYRALFDVLRLQGYCSAIAGATLPNPRSERLHESLGFRPMGRLPNAGFKFGKWYDVGFWYLPLRRLPKRPHELIPIGEILKTRKFSDALTKQAARV